MWWRSFSGWQPQIFASSFSDRVFSRANNAGSLFTAASSRHSASIDFTERFCPRFRCTRLGVPEPAEGEGIGLSFDPTTEVRSIFALAAPGSRAQDNLLYVVVIEKDLEGENDYKNKRIFAVWVLF